MIRQSHERKVNIWSESPGKEKAFVLRYRLYKVKPGQTETFALKKGVSVRLQAFLDYVVTHRNNSDSFVKLSSRLYK